MTPSPTSPQAGKGKPCPPNSLPGSNRSGMPSRTERGNGPAGRNALSHGRGMDAKPALPRSSPPWKSGRPASSGRRKTVSSSGKLTGFLKRKCGQTRQRPQKKQAQRFRGLPLYLDDAKDRLADIQASVRRMAGTPRRGLKIGTITLAVEPQAGQEPPEVRIRKWLKHAKRDCGMRASWPRNAA